MVHGADLSYHGHKSQYHNSYCDFQMEQPFMGWNRRIFCFSCLELFFAEKRGKKEIRHKR
jgi:hypothetical protein